MLMVRPSSLAWAIDYNPASCLPCLDCLPSALKLSFRLGVELHFSWIIWSDTRAAPSSFNLLHYTVISPPQDSQHNKRKLCLTMSSAWIHTELNNKRDMITSIIALKKHREIVLKLYRTAPHNQLRIITYFTYCFSEGLDDACLQTVINGISWNLCNPSLSKVAY